MGLGLRKTTPRSPEVDGSKSPGREGVDGEIYGNRKMEWEKGKGERLPILSVNVCSDKRSFTCRYVRRNRSVCEIFGVQVFFIE
mgnify:CR=1 FL=1